MRSKRAAELFGMRRRNVRIEPGLVLPDLEDDELVRRRSTLEDFEAHDASLSTAGIRQLPQQRRYLAFGSGRGIDVANDIDGWIGGILRARRRRGGKR